MAVEYNVEVISICDKAEFLNRLNQKATSGWEVVTFAINPRTEDEQSEEPEAVVVFSDVRPIKDLEAGKTQTASFNSFNNCHPT